MDNDSQETQATSTHTQQPLRVSLSSTLLRSNGENGCRRIRKTAYGFQDLGRFSDRAQANSNKRTGRVATTCNVDQLRLAEVPL